MVFGVQPRKVQWITFANLYVDYQLTWGCAGPIKFGKFWLDPETRPYLEVEQYTFVKMVSAMPQSSQQIGLAICSGAGGYQEFRGIFFDQLAGERSQSS